MCSDVSSVVFQKWIHKNYRSIEFRPDNFTQYLLSSEVGFSKCDEVLSITPHPSKRCQQPFQLFTKVGPFQESSNNSIALYREREKERTKKRMSGDESESASEIERKRGGKVETSIGKP